MVSIVVLLLLLIAQQTFLPSGVQSSDDISGIYPGDTLVDCCWLSDDGTVRVSPPANSTALLLDVAVPDFALSNGPQQLSVKIGDDPEQKSATLTPGDNQLVIKLPEGPIPPQLAVEIKPSHTFVPAQLGMNQDPRHLSVLVRAVGFATPPHIIDLHLDKTVVESGDVVTGTLTTSANVTSVDAHIANINMSVPKVGEGSFMLRYTVPKLPRFLRRTYDLVVVASNAAGDKVQQVVPITIH